jgi:transposase
MLPNDLPPWYTVYQQTPRWLKAGVCEALVHDLWMLWCEIADRAPQLMLKRFITFMVESA